MDRKFRDQGLLLVYDAPSKLFEVVIGVLLSYQIFY